MAKVLGRANQARDWLQTNANWPAKCPPVSSELYEQGDAPATVELFRDLWRTVERLEAKLGQSSKHSPACQDAFAASRVRFDVLLAPNLSPQHAHHKLPHSRPSFRRS